MRVGAANAGHTVYARGEAHVMQQLPCAAYASPDAMLFIGPGAQISREILEDEVSENQEWRADRRLPELSLTVDPRAHVVTQEHVDREATSGLAERIGSTSATAREGIGAAQAARVMRDESCVLARDCDWLRPWLGDVPKALASQSSVLLEGTQGTGLSLTTGQFPYCTSRNTTAAGLCADAGVAPGRLERVILVVRTFPIRVAGNSGPFWRDSDEVSWEDLRVDPDSERTTVTRKVRRVATFSAEQVQEAALLNGATEVAVTFMDYLCPELAGVTQIGSLRDYEPVARFIAAVEDAADAQVSMIGTGPATVAVRAPHMHRSWAV